ncbi:MAG: type II secretion system protein M [Alphaproteobacteria bacterium]|nr:type II secretion system protein M [Alphaproteobacteria bacterium]
MSVDRPPDDRKSAFVPLALLAVFSLLLAAFAAAPFLAHPVLEEEIAGKANVLRLQRAKTRSLNRSQLSAMTPQAARRAFLRATTDGIAGAELQQRILNIAARLGLEVQSSQSLQPVRSDGLALIAVRLELTGTIAHLQALLHSIETSEPILFVEQLSIAVAPSNRAAKKSASNDPNPQTKTLQIGLTVQGYLDEEQSS